MKYLYVFTLFFCLISLGAAIPIPSDSSGSQPPKPDKGKGRADPPKTPTPETNQDVPLPGRSGLHTDPKTKVTTFYYGDDNLPEHMGHLKRNQDKFPQNRNPLPLGDAAANRKEALHNIGTPPPHPVSKWNRVRDEKLPATLKNPNHKTTTTVEYLPEYESRIEGKIASSFRAEIKRNQPGSMGQLRPNPGWLPVSPNQRRGHEAPARLNSQTFVGPSPKVAKSEWKEPKKDGKGEPPKKGPSNLQPGRQMPVWKPLPTGEPKASHFGAPGQLKDGEKRQPPRPQNRDQYLKQLQQKKDEEAKHKAAPGVTKPPQSPQPKKDDKGKQKEKTLTAEEAKKKQKAADNLKAFENKFGPAKPVGKVAEAPARLGTQAGHPSPPRSPARPATPAARPATPAARPPTTPPPPPRRPSQPPPKPQGSSSKPAPKPGPGTSKKR